MSFFVVYLAVAMTAAEVHRGPIDPSQATVTAVRSGRWSQPETWGGSIPPAGSRVLIPGDLSVTLDCATERLDWLQVDGGLIADSTAETAITAHTVSTGMGSILEIGTESSPARCMVTFTDSPFYEHDFAQQGRGLLAMGAVEIHGVPKTHASEDGFPLDWSHKDDIRILEPHAVNLTRSVVFRSESKERRGHVMFMNPSVNCCYASFVDLGRTDKSKPVSDPEAGDNSNPRARYSLHFHRTGAPSPANGSRFDSEGRGRIVSQVVGCVVDGSPGWGFVNHVANVEFRQCIAIDVFGAGFATEEGDEAGAFIDCIAANCVGLAKDGNPDNVKGIAEIADWGKAGDGFWLQSPLVETRNCTAYNCSGSGFNIFDFEFNIGGGHGSVAEHLKWPITIEPGRLPKPIVSDSPVETHLVPCQYFVGNRAYRCSQGLQRWSDPNPWGAMAKIEMFRVEESFRYAVNLEYSHGNALNNISVVNRKESISTGIFARGGDLSLNGFYVLGRGTGVRVPTSGVNIISDGRVSNCASAFSLAGPEGDAFTLIEDCQIDNCGRDMILTPNIKSDRHDSNVVFVYSEPVRVTANGVSVNGNSGDMTLGQGKFQATNDRGSYDFLILKR